MATRVVTTTGAAMPVMPVTVEADVPDAVEPDAPPPASEPAVTNTTVGSYANATFRFSGIVKVKAMDQIHDC